MRKVDPVLNEQLQTLISSMGCELVGCELSSQGSRTLFRLYIDKPNGVTVDDCSLISRQVGAMLEVEGTFEGRYNLEVSSPGIDRPLFELSQFCHFVGSRVKLKLHTALNKSKQYKGVLLKVEGDDIYLQIEESAQELRVPFSMIEKANIIGDVRL